MDRKLRDTQALRLVNAYLKIDNDELRETIVLLAEAAADGATFKVRHSSVEDAPPKVIN